jgi:hypothetical protein
MCSSTHSLTSALDGGEWSVSHSGRFTSREGAPGTHWTGDWVGPRAVRDVVVKRKIPSPRRESNPRTPMRNENPIWMEILHTFLFRDNFSLEESLKCEKNEGGTCTKKEMTWKTNTC